MDLVCGTLSEIDVSILIASLSLVIALLTASSGKKHNKLSVKPLICDGLVLDSRNLSFVYHIHNKGLGTAKILGFKYFWADEEISAPNLKAMIRTGLTEWDFVDVSNMGVGYAIAKDEDIVLIEISIGEASSKQDNRLERLNHTYSLLLNNCRIKIDMESIYGEKDSFTTSISAIDFDELKPKI